MVTDEELQRMVNYIADRILSKNWIRCNRCGVLKENGCFMCEVKAELEKLRGA